MFYQARKFHPYGYRGVNMGYIGNITGTGGDQGTKEVIEYILGCTGSVKMCIDGVWARHRTQDLSSTWSQTGNIKKVF